MMKEEPDPEASIHISGKRITAEMNAALAPADEEFRGLDIPRSPSRVTDFLSSDASFRKKLGFILNHHYFHIVVVILVILDIIFVAAELLIDLKILASHEEAHDASDVFHYLSISVLCIFLVEYTLKLFVMRLSFFKHCMEIFDLIVIIVSLILEILFRHSHSASTGTGLLVVLRLWRVTRIVNGIVLSVKIHANEKLKAEREERKHLEDELEKMKERNDQLERDLNSLNLAVQKILTSSQSASLNNILKQQGKKNNNE
ncbi:unnamed protein product [Notodromas monacha]|uniref:Voltage-gated hydrogen channel 1 n=1 Tax=Notodromas monacha TaxID=399045 RepID=A0A7R9GI52_9CRUS|nr:unnamed protein product [Notodromas monacha]CAG0922217.1 unnamed protein product [Notodromas monacha]